MTASVGRGFLVVTKAPAARARRADRQTGCRDRPTQALALRALRRAHRPRTEATAIGAGGAAAQLRARSYRSTSPARRRLHAHRPDPPRAPPATCTTCTARTSATRDHRARAGELHLSRLRRAAAQARRRYLRAARFHTRLLQGDPARAPEAVLPTLRACDPAAGAHAPSGARTASRRAARPSDRRQVH